MYRLTHCCQNEGSHPERHNTESEKKKYTSDKQKRRNLGGQYLQNIISKIRITNYYLQDINIHNDSNICSMIAQWNSVDNYTVIPNYQIKFK